MTDTMTAERPVEAEKLKVLPATTKVDAADFNRTRRRIEVANDVTLADLKRPGFWRRHIDRIDKGDVLEVTSPDYSLDVELRVIRKEVGLLYVRVLRAFESEEQAPVVVRETETLGEVPDNYIVNHTPATGWRVWTRDPSVELVRNLKSRAEATRWAIEHDRRAAAA